MIKNNGLPEVLLFRNPLSKPVVYLQEIEWVDRNFPLENHSAEPGKVENHPGGSEPSRIPSYLLTIPDPQGLRGGKYAQNDRDSNYRKETQDMGERIGTDLLISAKLEIDGKNIF